MISASAPLTALSMLLLSLALATVLLPLNRLPPAWRLAMLVVIAALVLLPVSNYPGWYYVRSIFGDPSVTALLFYIALLLQQYFSLPLYRPTEWVLLRWLLIAMTALLYPFALGLTMFDSYSLGYSNPWLLALVFIISLFCWLRSYYFLALIITAAVVAHSLQLLESRNLWDYLIDPLFLLVMLLSWLRPSLLKRNAGAQQAVK
jgi:hypothetical protein